VWLQLVTLLKREREREGGGTKKRRETSVASNVLMICLFLNLHCLCL